MKQLFLFPFVAAGLFLAVAPDLIASETQLLEGPSPIAEPYQPLHDGSFSGLEAPLSPDPLVAYRWTDTNPNDQLQTYFLAPVKITTDQPNSFANLESAKGPGCNVQIQGAGSIQFDFGVENAAWLEFDSPDLTGDVKMSISEYNEPSIMSGVANAVKTKTPVKYGNTYRLELNRDLYEGVRFGWIHVRSFSTSWRITAVRLVCQTKPVNYEGRFSCSDPLLTRMWYVGAYGVKLNMLHNNLGAILMDRGDRISWTGDNYPAHAAMMSAFADYPFVKTSLDRTATDDNGIASYSLYWVLSLMDYYRYTGDAAALQQHTANAKAKLQRANQIYANPTLKFFGWDERLGAGFQEAEVPVEPKDAFRMVFIRACREFAEGLRTIGNTVDANTFDQMADQRIGELRAEGKWENRFGLHAAADAVNAGFTSPDEQARFFEREFRDRATRNSFSSFNQYFVIQAMARMNRYDEALASIRDHWGGQIEYGGTAFFEVFWPTWTQILGRNDTIPNSQAGKTSLCHPWGSGITRWLSEEVLGIKPTSPGFTTYDIFPHLGRTLTNVSGDVATPKGNIHASFDVSTGIASIRAPEGTTGRIGIPTVEKTIESIHINGTLAWDGTFHAVPGVGGASANHDFIVFSGVLPGSYEMKMTYSGTTPTFTDVPWQYPTTFVKEDRTTSGGWGGKYGAQGSVIFGADGANNDRILLPSYVASITRKWGTDGAFPVVADSRAPAKDSTNQTRSNGVFYTGQTGLKQCLVLDIALKQPTAYQLALYFVDLDRKGRRQSVELLDLNTRKLIAPTRIYANFEGGMYAVYNCDRSVRLRVNQVRGDNAVLSGIFFDPALSPYSLWSTAITSPDDREKTDDPDGDGFTNHEEFLFGTPPITNTGNLTTLGKSGANLVVRWCQRASGVTYVLQESTTLENPWATSAVVPVYAADQTGLYSTEYIRNEAVIPIDSDRKFVRVQATE